MNKKMVCIGWCVTVFGSLNVVALLFWPRLSPVFDNVTGWSTASNMSSAATPMLFGFCGLLFGIGLIIQGSSNK
jgi:hypothetical protein